MSATNDSFTKTPPLNPDDDLLSLAIQKPPTDDDILAHLERRFLQDTIYTRIGEQCLVAVNPNRPLELSSDDTLKSYSHGCKLASEMLPHVFEMAGKAYCAMKKNKRNQAIVFIGECGGGKTFASQLALRQLVTLAKSKKSGEKTGARILKVFTILDSFGHARTSHNSNSSRFGKYVEVQFNARGKLVGTKFCDYLLDKKRVGDALQANERNFHIFYQLLAGASPDEKKLWHLQDESKFQLLVANSRSQSNRAASSAKKMAQESRLYDASQFSDLCTALKAVGLGKKYQKQIFQLLSCILHLGNVEFVDAESLEEAALVKNQDCLDLVSEMMGLKSRDLENALVFKTKLIRKEICTMFLDKKEAAVQRNRFLESLYSLLWSWLLETINKCVCEDEIAPSSTVGLLDLFGFENLQSCPFHQLLANYASERVHALFNHIQFHQPLENFRQQLLPFPDVAFVDNQEIMDVIAGTPTSILNIMDKEMARSRKRIKIGPVLEKVAAAHDSSPESFFSLNLNVPSTSASEPPAVPTLFTVRHYGGNVMYEAAEFVECSQDVLSPDFVNLFRGASDNTASRNVFLVNLFSERTLRYERAPQNNRAIVGVQQPLGPFRKPGSGDASFVGSVGLGGESPISTVNALSSEKSQEEHGKGEAESTSTTTVSFQFQKALDQLLGEVQQCQPWFVIHLRSNASQLPNRWDGALVASQLRSLGIADVIHMKSVGFVANFTHEAFCERAKPFLAPAYQAVGVQEIAAALCQEMQWHWTPDQRGDVVVGPSMVFVGEEAMHRFSLRERQLEREERQRVKDRVLTGGDAMDHDGATSQLSSYSTGNNSDWDVNSQVSASDYSFSDPVNDTESQFGSDFSYVTGVEKGDVVGGMVDAKRLEVTAEEEEEPISAIRTHWLRITACMTCCIASRCLEWNGMKRSDIQQAWREKVTLVMLIALLSMMMLFFITGFTLLLCPHENMYSLSEVAQHVSVETDLWLIVHGRVFDYTGPRLVHPTGAALVDQYKGNDTTKDLFPRSGALCGLVEDGDPHDRFFNATFDHEYDKSPRILNFKDKNFYKGSVAFHLEDLKRNANPNAWWIMINKKVYDVSNYRSLGMGYLGPEFTSLMAQNGGGDISGPFSKLKNRTDIIKCLDIVYYHGVQDTRDSPQCLFANTVLISATALLVAILVVKFLSALQFGSKGDPEDHDRFVICQVPCYTEGEENLRKTIDSLASLKYDDKRKLLFIIADGNIIGSGNDRATWRIALDILGVDPSIDPPKLSFLSLGEGNRQHNMGKIFTGLYDCSGHLVPYLVIVKTGKENEVRRPGNRGKRDSQLILMRFLQKVHYDEPMSPLELELYHQMKNVIGVDPSFYEFVLMVDADTEVLPDGLNRMISSMVHDAGIAGICGETTLANESSSLITMIQVYEYYISHHLSKAFESLFGSVTCLPGCFCMYRVRSPNKSIPILISQSVVEDYSVNDVDTLHKKNLLSLGEDRYLTTLMLKHFPRMKLKFTPDAQCRTNAPDRWSVLLSQRRRWINSTVHNLSELLLLPQLCGFCCFSMRFVVFFDLFATLVMPATMGYLVYLIYSVIQRQFFPLVSLILLLAGYGLQVVIFLLKQQWQHIGWLVIYILALPFFTFILPLYAFWHFDDFSWGNTRVVVGEKGGKKQILDEEPFDPASIPMKKWGDYEQEVWEKESAVTGMSSSKSYQSGTYNPSTVPSMKGAGGAFNANPPLYAISHSSMDPMKQQSRPISMATEISVNGSQPQYPDPSNPQIHLPVDEQIVQQIRSILATADLMTVTKKQVRDALSSFFQVDMMYKKEFINKTIEDILQGRMA